MTSWPTDTRVKSDEEKVVMTRSCTFTRLCVLIIAVAVSQVKVADNDYIGLGAGRCRSITDEQP